MTEYTQLSQEEREKLFIMRKQGVTYRNIAIAMDRDHSALVREYNRNTKSVELGYLLDTAHQLALTRKARHGRKIDRYPKLKEEIIKLMREDRYSPEIVAGRLKQQGSKVTISHESIYQFIYSQAGAKQQLYKLLMRSRPKRNQHYGRKNRSNYCIPGRVSISQRPELNAKEFGNFEADLTFFKGSKSINLSTMVERKTGYFMANLNATKHSEPIALKLLKNITNFPRAKRKSITFDNGKEFVDHLIISQVAGVPTYFCNPGSPWQKPYVETTHALLHRFIPKKTDAKLLTQEIVNNAITKLNNLPRRRHGFKTPTEMLLEEKIYLLGALRA
jgi:transposase, IS30 family